MRKLFVSIGISTLVFVLLSGVAHADRKIEVSDARLRLMPGDLPGAGYFRLHNGGSDAIRLIGAHGDAYKKIMMHKSVNNNGMASMKAVSVIKVAAGQDVEFAPSGYHLMLMHRTAPMKVGDTVVITLDFEGGHGLPVVFDVVSPAAM